MKNPFGDNPGPPQKNNPFGESESSVSPAEAVLRIEHAARKIRNLRAQIGAEGLSAPAARELIDEIASALEASAKVLRQL